MILSEILFKGVVHVKKNTALNFIGALFKYILCRIKIVISDILKSLYSLLEHFRAVTFRFMRFACIRPVSEIS